MREDRFLMICWVVLIVLSVATVELPVLGSQKAAVCMAIMLLAFIKGWLIIDGFMELRHAPVHWRLLLLAWPALMMVGVSGIIFI